MSSVKIQAAMAVLGIAVLSGCAAKYGTQAPAMPLSMDQAQAQANIKQAGINVSRQFVTAWENAKGNMKGSLQQCSLSAGSGYGSQGACWNQMQNQAANYAGQFSGMTVSGLTPAQMQSFAMAKQAAVNFFHLSARYAGECSVSTQSCIRNQDLRMQMNTERKAVDEYLMHASMASGSATGMQYENQAVNNNLENLRSPAMVPPSANQPAIQQGQ